MDIKEIIKKLSEKPRVAGTKRSKEIVRYLCKNFEGLGLKVEIQSFPFIGWDLIKEPKLIISGKTIKCLPVLWSGSTSNNGLEGKLIKVRKIKTYEAYEWLRYAIINKKGKKLAFLITRPDMVWLQCLNKPNKMPYFVVYPDTCKWIKERIEKGKEIKVKAFVKTMFKSDLTIQNIIAKRDSDRKIIVCAHYDSMFNSPGANDNASGIAALLELAEAFSNNPKIEFIAFDAEEWNKFGSYTYVKKLKKENELNKIKAVVNIDMIGAGKPYIIVSEGLKEGVKRAAKRSNIKEVEITTNVRAPFDYWPFYKEGVQIVHFVCSPYNYCHDPKDTIDKISSKPIKEVIKIAKSIIRYQLDFL